MKPSDQASLAWRTETGEGRRAVALVQSVAGEEITVRLPEALAVGQTVLLDDGTALRTAMVNKCEPQAGGFLVRLAFERRREQREPAGGRGVLRWTGPSGSQTVEAQVRDISSDGMQLELPSPVEVDQTVRLVGENFECIGLVRYCRPDGVRFVAGIQFTRAPYEKASLEYQD
ncbi:MAG: PilZ domain-containing protein [Acidobacteria bacterium]|nr:PilZ domain-containing protein [Acidobacteriota bacterium]